MKKTLYIYMAVLALGACSSLNPDLGGEAKYPDQNEPANRSDSLDIYSDTPSVLGDDGLTIFDTRDKGNQDGGGGIGVNSFLWRASLDTISFMPLTTADPFGGVILTDWYSAPETPDERFKMNILILGRQLRADGIKVTVFRQTKQGSSWVDAAVAKDTALNVEDTILTRARELRIEQLAREAE